MFPSKVSIIDDDDDAAAAAAREPPFNMQRASRAAPPLSASFFSCSRLLAVQSVQAALHRRRRRRRESLQLILISLAPLDYHSPALDSSARLGGGGLKEAKIDSITREKSRRASNPARHNCTGRAEPNRVSERLINLNLSLH